MKKTKNLKSQIRTYRFAERSLVAYYNQALSCYMVQIQNFQKREVLEYWSFDTWEEAYSKFSEVKESGI